MSLLVTLNGQNYIIPQTNEVGWGSNLDDFFVAIPAGVLQKTGGSFTLTAETDFGATYGLKSAYYKSRTANVASAGQVRLASADTIGFRNNANGADIALDKDSSDNLRWNATKLLLSGAVVNADINASAAIAYSKLALTGSIVNADVNASAAIVRSKLAATESSDVTYASGKGVFLTDSGSKTIKFTAPTTLANTYAWKLPTDQGGANQYLTNDGSGNLSWSNAAGTGTVNSGTQYQLAYYATSTNAVSGDSALATSSNKSLLIGPSSAQLGSADRVLNLSTVEISNSIPAIELQANRAGVTGNIGQIQFWNNSNQNALINSTNGGTVDSGQLIFLTKVASGSLTTALTLDSSQNATFAGTVTVNSVAIPAVLVTGSLNGNGPRLMVRNTNTTAGQARTGLVTAQGDNASVELSLQAGKDASNNNVEMVGGTTKVSLGIGGTEYGRQTTTQFLNQDGAVGTPTFSFISDPDTGVYRVGANDLALATGGTKALEINASQQVDIANTKQTVGGNQVFPIVQVVSATTTTVTTTTSTTFVDTSLTASITPKFNTSKILVLVTGQASTSAAGNDTIVTLVRASTDLGPFADIFQGTGGKQSSVSINYYDSPATTSATTYKIQIKGGGGSTAQWGITGQVQSIVLIEVAQ